MLFNVFFVVLLFKPLLIKNKNHRSYDEYTIVSSNNSSLMVLHIENHEELFTIVTGNMDLPNIVKNFNVLILIVSYLFVC